MDSSVLVTGGTGFLGGRLLDRLLSAGTHVVVISRRPQPALIQRGVRVVVGSLSDSAVCREATSGVSSVFHVAARVGVWGRYEDFYRDNVIATRVLLEAARKSGVGRFVYTSTPSVVYNGQGLAGEGESLPLTRDCPSPYPLTKAMAEKEVLALNQSGFRTTALRPHLIWGEGDPHLVPRILNRAQQGRLRIVGNGRNRVDMVHVENAVDAHLLAERALCDDAPAAGKAYFITNDEPVVLWEWINELLCALDRPQITRRISLTAACSFGLACELLWRGLRLKGEPPMTRFVAAELAKDHWFSIDSAKRDLDYSPKISMAEGTKRLVAWLRGNGY